MLKRYAVRASFGISYVVVGEIEGGMWSAVIMALNRNLRAESHVVHEINEQATIQECQRWISENIECGAQMVQE